MRITVDFTLPKPVRAATKAQRLVATILVSLALAFIPSVAVASHLFSDVPDSHPQHAQISRVVAAGIMNPCSPSLFCPNETVKRGQQAAQWDRALGLNGTAAPNTFVSRALTVNNVYVKRLRTTVMTAGTVVATTGAANIERDGTEAGFRLNRFSTAILNNSISCTGINAAGAWINFHLDDAPAGITAIYTDAQGVVSFECIFGNPFNSVSSAPETHIVLHREGGDYFWQGFSTSTVNQTASVPAALGDGLAPAAEDR